MQHRLAAGSKQAAGTAAPSASRTTAPTLMALALVLDYAVTLVENHLLRWRPTGGETVKAAG